MAKQDRVRFRIVLLFLLLATAFDFLIVFEKRGIHDAENLNTRAESDFVTRSFFSRLIEPSSTTNSKVLIIGDSYAQDFMNALIVEPILEEGNIDTIHISAACGLNFDPAEVISFIPAVHRQNCVSKAGLSRFEHFFGKYELIILASKWETWHINVLEDVVRRLKLSGIPEIIIVGAKYLSKPDLSQLSGRGRESRHFAKGDDFNSMPQNAKKNEMRLQELAERTQGVRYINIAKYFEAGWISQETIVSSLLTFDGYHLTRAGAKYLGHEIKLEHLLPCSDLGQTLAKCRTPSRNENK